MNEDRVLCLLTFDLLRATQLPLARLLSASPPPAGLAILLASAPAAQVVACLTSLLLADAQSLTVLRAVAKGNQPSLVASISLDTAALYRQGWQQLQRSGVADAPGSKLDCYLQYKTGLFESYAHLFLGIDWWQRQQPGVGLRCLQEAAAQLAVAKKAAAAFDAAAPPSMNLVHRRHDEQLEMKLADVQRRMKREAEMVHFQAAATTLPPLPPPKRLVSPLPFAMPPAAADAAELAVCFPAVSLAPPAAVGSAGAGGAHGVTPAATAAAAAAAAAPPAAAAAPDTADQGCSCFRWALFLVAAPLLLVLSALGVVVWILLLPVKIICCPIGCAAQIIANAVEHLVKAPLQWMYWASGKPWERAPAPHAAAPAVKD